MRSGRVRQMKELVKQRQGKEIFSCWKEMTGQK